MTALLVIHTLGVVGWSSVLVRAYMEPPAPAPGVAGRLAIAALVIALWPLAFAAVVVLAIAWALGDDGPIDLEE